MARTSLNNNKSRR